MTVRMTLEAFFMCHTKQSCDGYQQPLIKVAAGLSWQELPTCSKTEIKFTIHFFVKKIPSKMKWEFSNYTEYN